MGIMGPYRGYIGIMGLDRGYIGIMEKKMETTIMGFLSFFRTGNPLSLSLSLSLSLCPSLPCLTR